MRAWGPWVVDCIRMLDGDGAYAHLPYSPVYMRNPAYDMTVYDVIRSRWNELRNEDMKKAARK